MPTYEYSLVRSHLLGIVGTERWAEEVQDALSYKQKCGRSYNRSDGIPLIRSGARPFGRTGLQGYRVSGA